MKNAVKLKLPISMRIHPVVNISRVVRYNVIRRECGRTLARVRVSWTYISIIIISLQRT